MSYQDYIDMEFLQKVQDDFSAVTGMAAITIHTEDNTYMTQPSNFTDFCQKYIRSSKEGERRCIHCDETCDGVYECHAGLLDFSANLKIGDTIIGKIKCGQVLAAPPEEEKITKIADELGLDPKALFEEAKKLPIKSMETIQSSANLLFSIVSNIVNSSYLQKMKQEKESAEASNKAKSNFLANMSHEIRTPINAIIGFTKLILEETDINDRVRQYAGMVDSSSSHLLSLINDILDFSKIEDGRMELLPTVYHLQALVNEVQGMVSLAVQEKGLEFCLDMNRFLPYKLYGDKMRIRQILTNILNNAVKFTEKGSITFKIEGRMKDKESMELIFTIADTGMGIKKEDLNHLFVRFQRLNPQKTNYIEGTGLGLVISKSFAEMMGGDIEVESEYGKGTAFTIRIPQKIIDRTPICKLGTLPVSEKKKEDASLKFTGKRVLVVDDNKVNLLLTKELLKRYDIFADTVESGAASIEKMETARYDLIFMDHLMPEMDGVETLHKIRNTENEYFQTVPIVALTAEAITGSQEYFLKEGFQDYLSKPIAINLLEQILQRILGNGR